MVNYSCLVLANNLAPFRRGAVAVEWLTCWSEHKPVRRVLSMTVLIVQLFVILALLVALILWLMYFPYPSPVIRRCLPPRKRWPEKQIRGWLQSDRFQSAFVRYFYRDPERMAPPGASILAPADGLISGTNTIGGTRYIVIALGFWDMHVQRSPLSGVVLRIDSQGADFMDGEGRDFAFLRHKPCPVQKRIVISTAVGDVAVRLITSLAARRIEVWLAQGQEVERGARIGRILLGSTVVLELPEHIPVLTEVGARVWAGETPIAGSVDLP